MGPSHESAVSAGWAPQIFLTVGTDHHPFNRMAAYADDLVATFPQCSVFVQTGTSQPPERAAWKDYLTETEMRSRLLAASAVVTHGGPATIMAARRAGHLPIAVPRRGNAGEHVDDHQVSFCGLQAAAGTVVLADSVETLRAAVAEALERPSDLGFVRDNRDTVRAFEFAVRRLLAWR